MRRLPIALAGVSAASLAAVTAFAGTAGAHTSPALESLSHPAAVHPLPKGECYGLMKGDSGRAILSQNFEQSMSQFDSAGASDFPAGVCRTISGVQTAGVYFNGAGPADSVNVIFYTNHSPTSRAGIAHPGRVTHEYDDLSFTDSTGSGALGVTIPKTKTSKGGWVSFVANMDFATGGEWGWEVSTIQQGNPDVWENPGGSGICKTWNTNFNCFGVAGDDMVSLIGTGK